MKKLIFLSYGYLSSSFIAILLIVFNMKSNVPIFSAFTFGICYSLLYPLLMATPAEYNLQFTPSQGANFMIWVSLGEGAAVTLVGYLMEWINNDMLFY